MPKGRMLNRKISLDKEVAKLSKETAILYTWTIPHLDCEGKIHADPSILKGVVVPYLKYMTLKVIERSLQELADSHLVIVYGNGYKYMKFLGFDKNQNIQEGREAASDIPDPTPEELKSSSRETPAKDKISKDKIREGANAPPSDEEFIKTLKTNPAYKHIDLDTELSKMDAWLLTRPGRKKTKRFIVNWLNKIDKPIAPLKRQPIINPNCTTCNGTGKIQGGDMKGRPCYCVR